MFHFKMTIGTPLGMVYWISIGDDILDFGRTLSISFHKDAGMQGQSLNAS